jgi:SET domain-containing protein
MHATYALPCYPLTACLYSHISKDPTGNKGAVANCTPKIMLINGEHRVGFYADMDIAAGTEILFQYGWENKEKQLGISK